MREEQTTRLASTHAREKVNAEGFDNMSKHVSIQKCNVGGWDCAAKKICPTKTRILQHGTSGWHKMSKKHTLLRNSMWRHRSAYPRKLVVCRNRLWEDNITLPKVMLGSTSWKYVVFRVWLWGKSAGTYNKHDIFRISRKANEKACWKTRTLQKIPLPLN